VMNQPLRDMRRGAKFGMQTSVSATEVMRRLVRN
jgi:hypothetical protein